MRHRVWTDNHSFSRKT